MDIDKLRVEGIRKAFAGEILSKWEDLMDMFDCLDIDTIIQYDPSRHYNENDLMKAAKKISDLLYIVELTIEEYKRYGAKTKS